MIQPKSVKRCYKLGDATPIVIWMDKGDEDRE
jgi:hypothetical protein